MLCSLIPSTKNRGRETMIVRIAYIEEPPFGWTGRDQTAMGADIELADVVLRPSLSKGIKTAWGMA